MNEPSELAAVGRAVVVLPYVDIPALLPVAHRA
jgi:hypothetical protein